MRPREVADSAVSKMQALNPTHWHEPKKKATVHQGIAPKSYSTGRSSQKNGRAFVRWICDAAIAGKRPSRGLNLSPALFTDLA